MTLRGARVYLIGTGERALTLFSIAELLSESDLFLGSLDPQRLRLKEFAKIPGRHNASDASIVLSLIMVEDEAPANTQKPRAATDSGRWI